MAKGKGVKIRVETDTNGLEQRVLRAAAEMQVEINDTVRNVSDDAELIYAAFARKDTGRMSRGVKAKSAGAVGIVTVHARNPRSGFDYVAVTRWGHLARRIKPRHPAPAGRYLANIPGVGPRWTNKRAALSTPFGFRASVRGFRPKYDWATVAPLKLQIKQSADAAMEWLGIKIITKMR